jgi:hypothetical protein
MVLKQHVRIRMASRYHNIIIIVRIATFFNMSNLERGDGFETPAWLGLVIWHVTGVCSVNDTCR